MNKSREILEKIWGFNDFRPLQEEIVQSILYGHDTLAILPTGGGKSICYQVPGLSLGGTTLVISPLIALMEDQVSTLRKKGVKAELITSAMGFREIDIALDNARFGGISFLYTSPERLRSNLFLERFKAMNISLIAVDEAHCISEWGHDFRPAYRQIAEIRSVHPEVPMIALTASATIRVENDIIEQLKLNKTKIFKGSLTRNNLRYLVRPSSNKLQRIIDFCAKQGQQSGIVYCQTRRSVKHLVQQLRANNINAGFYHGGLNASDRKYMLNAWLNNDIRVMVATNAFGMGIDKPDVRFVLHYEIPDNLEAYYQEAGRAGRDGKEAQAITYWEQSDIDRMREYLRIKYPEIQRVKEVYECICNYLKIAFGSGVQETYDFNMAEFHQKFSMSYTETYYSLKILELSGLLVFNENQFFPTKLKFVVGNSALYKFQIAHERISALITLLTRSYPGIHDRFVKINERELAKRLKINDAEINDHLKYLEQYGIIDITWQSNLPKLTFTQERLHSDNISLSNESYHQRQQIEQMKMNSIIDYLNSDNCRQAIINEYFGAPPENCGKCDNCIANLHENHSLKEVIQIIPTLLPSSLENIANKLQANKETTERAIHRLLLEEKIKLVDNKFILND